MKAVIKTGRSGFRWARLGGIAAFSLCLASGAAFSAEIADTQTQTAPVTVLPWISEVVKMNDANVPQDVIANYVKNTSARSTLSADDIIYLHDHNVSSTLITAMIEHGAVAAAPAPAAAVQMPATPPPVPAYAQYPAYAQMTAQGYGTQPTAVNYNYYGSSDNGYNGDSGYSAPYSYYSSWWSYPYYPYYYYPIYYYPFCNNHGFHNGFCPTGVHSHGNVSHWSSGMSHASFSMGGGHSMGGMHH